MKWFVYVWFVFIAITVMPLPLAAIGYIYTGDPIFSEQQLVASMLSGIMGTFFTVMATLVDDLW